MSESRDLPFIVGKPREFAQKRARRTYEALVEAAARVFAEKGFDATQTPDIAGAAGVSVGTFYRYFDDKRDVFLEILRRDFSLTYRETMSRLTPESFVGEGPRSTIEAVIQILSDLMSRAPRRQRLYLELSMRDPEVAAIKQAYDRESRRRIATLLRAICSAELVRDPDAMAYIIHTSVVECSTSISGARGPLPVSRARAVAALTEVVYRSLFGVDE